MPAFPKIRSLAWMFLCALTMACNVTATHLPKQTASNRLISPNCSLEVQMKAGTCPKLAIEIKPSVAFCGFSCPIHEVPVCQDTDFGPVYFCSQENVTCDKGVRRRVEVNLAEPTMLYIIEEVCPDGRYQPTPSDCYSACRYSHPVIFSEQFRVKSSGTNVSPAVLYCNYTEGYYNDKGKLFVKADTFDLEGFCTHVRIKDPCPDNEADFPLPNGTCVENCSDMEYRDDFDDFKCKLRQRNVNDKQNSSTGQSASKQDFGTNQIPDRTPPTPVSTMIATSTTTTVSGVDEDKVKVTTQKTNDLARDNDSDDTVPIVIGVIVGFTVAVAISSIGIYCCWVRRKSKQADFENPDPADIVMMSVREQCPADKGVMQTEHQEDCNDDEIQAGTPEPPGSAGNDERPALIPEIQVPTDNNGKPVVKPGQLTSTNHDNTTGEFQAPPCIDGRSTSTPRHQGHTENDRTHQEHARPAAALDGHGNCKRKRRRHVTKIVTEWRYSSSDSSSVLNDSSEDDDDEGNERKSLMSSGQGSIIKTESEETLAATSEHRDKAANEERGDLMRLGRTNILHGNDEERQPFLDSLKDGFNEG